MIPSAAFLVDTQGTIKAANELAEKLFAYGPGELIGQPMDTLLPPAQRKSRARQCITYRFDQQTHSLDSHHELDAVCRDGRHFPAEVALHRLAKTDDLVILATIRNISRRKVKERKLRRSQQQQRELTAHLITLRDTEQARLSRTLHDELGQMMTGLKMDLVWLQRQLGADQTALLQKTAAMMQLLDSSIDVTRHIAADLRPGLLDDFGLEAAVAWQLQEFQERTEIPCTFSSEMHGCTPDADCATAAFSVFKEALTNIARHAAADAAISFSKDSSVMVTL